MRYRKHIYAFLIFIFTLVSGAYAQETADFRVLQSQSNDTLYLKFELKASSTPFLLRGYNLVFKIDPAVVDTNNFVLVDQGKFGSSTINYFPTQILKHINPGVFQIKLNQKIPVIGAGVLLQNVLFQNVGIAAFKIKKCGASGLSFPNQPKTSIADWSANDVTITTIPVSPLSLTSKFSPKPVLKSSKSIVCVGSSIDLIADSNVLFSNYALFSKSKTGVVSSVSAVQAKSVFKNIIVTDTASYFVTFDLGTCKDTTTLATVFTASKPLPVTINTSNNSPCLGEVVSYSVSPITSGNKYVWKLSPIGTPAIFVGASNGTSVQVDFKGSVAYLANITVQDTNSFGCAGIATSKILQPKACSFNADFEVNGSNFAVSACQSADVSFKDASTVSGGFYIVKWEWDFGPGAVPDTFSTVFAAPDPRNISPVVKYTTAGVVGVRLIITNNLGAKDTIVKSPTISVLAGLTETPLPTCGSSSCNEVNFNWALVQGATNYQVRYKKGKNGVFQPFQNAGIVNTFKVNASSVGMGGTLDFNDTKNDTVYFQVRALASTCDTTTSNIVFCRPSYCITQPNCNLPSFTILPTAPSCLGSTASLKVNTTPNDFYNQALYKSVRFSWDNGKFDTSHIHLVTITEASIQNVKLLVIDTTLANCYSLNTVSIPVTPVLTSKPDLGIQSLECDKVTFVWKHVSGAVGYEIQYSGTCIATQAWRLAPLGGLAEFFEISNLTDSCKLNFNVRALGGCDTTQSDTLVAPPTCTCYIGHIASSNTKSCALDTVRFSVSDFQIPNWLISWENPITGIPTAPSKDSVYTFIPVKSDTIYRIKYTIIDPSNSNCNTVGYVFDTTGTPGNAAWAPRKTDFCIKDAIYYLDNQVSSPGYSFFGKGIVEIDNKNYFNASLAGLGTHIISYNACGSVQSHNLKVVSEPCVTTVVDAGSLADPQGLYTACDGTIFITDRSNLGIYRYVPGTPFGSPELIVKSSSSSLPERFGNLSIARFGEPYGIVFDESDNNTIYFVDKTKSKVKKIVIDKQKLEKVVGDVSGDEPTSLNPVQDLIDGRFNDPHGLAIHPNADTLYVSDITNLNIKSFTFKDANPKIKLVAGSGTVPLPARGKDALINLPYNLAVDSLRIIASDYGDRNLFNYSFQNDSVKNLTQSTISGYLDGKNYRVRLLNGVTPKIGKWIYFTDIDNYSLRRINTTNNIVETVAGSPPPVRSNVYPNGTGALGANGLPFNSRFSKPGPVFFNIKGYIDILDAGPPTAVRRYYLPNWGETWTGFDTTYVTKCDRDTARPVFGGGRLRVISGKDLTAVINDSIFAPKDTGQYLLGYYLKIGRCDTTFMRNVYVKAQPKSNLKGDTVCADSVLIRATNKKDTTVRYKWYGPGRTALIASKDTSRTIAVTKTGKYFVEIYYGKKKQCFLLDSANVAVIPKIKLAFSDSLTCVENTTLFTPALVDSTQFTYNWDFGVTPKITSPKAKTSFNYATYGTYQVQLIGWNKAVPSCRDTVTKSVKITTRPRLDLSINGLSDTAKYCSSVAIQANLLAKVVTDVNAAGAPFTFKWQETYPKGGKLDSSFTLDNTIASPQTRVGESSSLFGYKVSVTDSKNCVSRSDSVYARVSLPPVFTVDAMPLSPICKGQSVTLTPKETVPSTDKYSYKWDTSGVRLNLDLDTLKASLSSIPKSNVTYKVLIKNLKTLCTYTASKPIQLRKITINFDPLKTLIACSLDTTPIVANVSNGGTQIQWVRWTNDANGKTPISLFNYSADSLSVFARRDSSRVYRIVLKDKDGCTDSSKVNVPASTFQPPAFTITKGKDTLACVGSSVKVSLKVTKGKAPFKFVWSKPTEVNITDLYNPVITPAASGNYVVTMTDANNCGQATDTVKMTSYKMSVFANNDATSGLCRSISNPNPTANLEVTVSNTPTVSGATYTYNWINIGTNTNLNINSDKVLYVSSAGSYEVQVKNNLTGCVHKDTTSFKILNKPEKLTLSTGIPSISCSARTISLSTSFAPPISSKSDSITYKWKVGTNAIFQTPNKYDSATVANLSTTDIGNLTFKVYAENKCGIDSSSKQVIISGTPKPNSDLKGGTFCDTIATLAASIVEDPTLNYKWSGPDNINTIISDDATRKITTKTSGKYWVLIYDKNNPGCNKLDSATISLYKAVKGAIQLVSGPANKDTIKVCNGVSVNLAMQEATTTQPKFEKFSWNSGENTRQIAALGSKWFKVAATDALGCVVTDSFRLEEQPLPIACINVLDTASNKFLAVNKVVNICSGNQYTISDPCNKSSNGPLDSLIVKWQRRDLNGVLTTINPRGVTQTGSYTFIETITPRLNGSACLNSTVDSVMVVERLLQPISIVDTASDIYICNNSFFGLSAQPATFVKYFWTLTNLYTSIVESVDTTLTNSIGKTIVSTDPSLDYIVLYAVKGVDKYGCISEISETPKAISKVPVLDFTITENCLGIITRFSPAIVSDSAKYDYKWDFGDPTTNDDVSSKAVDSYLYTLPGNYKVRLNGQSKISNLACDNIVEKTIKIKANYKLDLTIDGATDTSKICVAGAVVNLSANSNPISTSLTYNWSEVGLLGGKLDAITTSTGINTAKPTVRLGETTSVFGYTVQAIDPVKCVSGRDTTFVRVSIPPDFDLNLSSKDTVCKGETISVSAINKKPSAIKARYKFVWDTSSVELSTKTLDLIDKPNTSATYRFTVLDSTTTCTVQKSIPVTVLRPTIFIPTIPKPAACASPDSISIEAQVFSAKLPLLSIQWIDSAKNLAPTSLYNPSLLIVKAFRDTSRTYSLIIKDQIGCVDTAFVRVNASNAEAPKFEIVNGRSRNSCVKTDIKVALQVITGRPQYQFVWTADKIGTPATGIDATDVFNPIISTSNISSYPKKYYVTFNDANNCFPALDSVEINQPADMRVSITGKADNICKTLANPNPPTSLEAVPADLPPSTTANYNYVWRNIEKDQIVSSGSSFLNNVSTSGNYEVEVTNLSSSCVRKDTAIVSILNAPENPVISLLNPTVTCNSKPILLLATFNSPAKTNKDNIAFEWSAVGGSNLISSFDSSVVYFPNSSDIGDITFKVTAKNRCGETIATALPFRLVPAARAKLNVDANEVSINKNLVFTNNSINTDSLVVLKITDGTNHDFGKVPGGTFNHNFPNKGTYKAKLYVINQNGCDDEDSVTITVIDKLNIFIPNVFSPTANDENNRFLRVYGVNISQQSFNLLVYNRWGQLVYSTNDLYTAMNKGWDGNDSSGESQMGVYTYILTGKFNTGVSINQTGTVTLLR